MKKLPHLLMLLLLPLFVKAQKNIYSDNILLHRNQTDLKFLNETSSPLPQEEIVNFSGLNYFPVKENFKVQAIFKKHKNPEVFLMKTSTGRLPEYRKYGEVCFTLNGRQFVLQVYQNVELSKKEEYKDYLFIPFTDLTNGKTTYGSGRYLDFKIPKSRKVELDFNLAYNPYCAYNSKYSCPVPPAENFLEIEIPAGEKNYFEY